ncbi:hypothetical protein JW979_11460, partial [bacterium]|nr:hypothetical protein [candidate division CSSED10-310 bacterium]
TLMERDAIVRLLDRCLYSDSVLVAIGDETEIPEISEMSVVTSKYTIDDKLSGALGVIGPKRMPYEFVVSLVKYMADLLSIIMKNIDDPDAEFHSSRI